MQVLHSLGGWPEGLWHRTDLSGQPGGALVWIQLRGSALHVLQLNHAAERTGAFCQILLNTTRVSVENASASFALRCITRCCMIALCTNKA